MFKTTRLGLAALGLFALATPAHAWEILPPFKVNFVFRVNVCSTAHPQPSAPWWAYFPQDDHQMAVNSGPKYPHWPAQFPPAGQPTSAPQTPAAGPNMVYFNAPATVQPAGYYVQPNGYYLAPPPASWYSR